MVSAHERPKDSKWITVAVLAFIGAYVAVEAYYAGKRDGELVTTEVPSAESDETDSTSKQSQPDEED